MDNIFNICNNNFQSNPIRVILGAVVDDSGVYKPTGVITCVMTLAGQTCEWSDAIAFISDWSNGGASDKATLEHIPPS